MTAREQALYWVWLQGVLGPGSGKAHDILRDMPQTGAVWDMTPPEVRYSPLFNAREREAILQKDLSAAYKILEDCHKLGIRIVTCCDKEYPTRLREIYNPPLALYVKGQLGRIDAQLCIAMVGTRTATDYGRQMAKKFAFELTRAGCVVVSGCARGVDMFCHKAALEAGGRTIGVLGCGIDTDYLRQFESVRREIARTGAIVSEYPPGTPALPGHFPVRNRIISGLSLGCVVVEAGRKSGSLITARLAMEQNRDVFAVPGSVLSQYSEGANYLIAQGAMPALSAEDILSAYDRKIYLHNQQNPPEGFDKYSYHPPVYEVSVTPKMLEGLTPNALKVYGLMSETPEFMDVLAEKAGLSMYQMDAVMTELEMAGVVFSHSGRRYSRV